MEDKPAVLLVHGFWGNAGQWAKVIVELNRRGYTSLHAVENPLTSLPNDAQSTRTMIRQIDGPVVLVGHSYGGALNTLPEPHAPAMEADPQSNVVPLFGQRVN